MAGPVGSPGPLHPKRLAFLALATVVGYILCLELYYGDFVARRQGRVGGEAGGHVATLEGFVSSARTSLTTRLAGKTSAAAELEMIREREQEVAGEDEDKEEEQQQQHELAGQAMDDDDAGGNDDDDDNDDGDDGDGKDAEAPADEEKEEEEDKVEQPLEAEKQGDKGVEPPSATTEKEKKKAKEEEKATKPALENAETRCLAQAWIQKHAQLQREMFEGKRPAKYLVYRPDCGYCGMCNRLNGMLGTYLAAVLMDRAFIIDWRYPGKHGWEEGTWYLDPRVVDWRAESALGGKPTFDLPENRTRMLEGWGGDPGNAEEVFRTTDFASLDAHDALVIRMVGEAPTLALMKNPEAKKRAVERGIMAENTEWSDAWNEAFKGCAVRALFQPSPTLTKLYCGMLGGAGAPHRGIGIHVRTGDDRTWNAEFSEPKDEHFRFAQCADGMRRAALEVQAKRGRNLTAGVARPMDVGKWHVASDYQKVVDDVRAKYPDAVASMEQDFDKKDELRVHSAGTWHQQFTSGPLLELIHLSSAMAVVGTCRSSFSASAGYFGLLPPEFVILKRTNFEQRYFHTTNCPEMPEDAEAVCHDIVADHGDLLEEVLRTPPFITCPADGGSRGEKEEEEEEGTAEARR